jgi:hypothetical protein
MIYQDTVKPKVKRDTIYFHCGSTPGSQYSYTANIAVNFITSCPTCTYNWINHNGGFVTPTNVPTGIITYLGSYTCIVTNSVNGCSSKFIMDVICNVGLNEYNSSIEFLDIFPNPMTNTLKIISKINTPIERINIFNSLGQNAIEIKPPDLQDDIDLSSLPSGIYFISIKVSSQIKTFKIIKL